VALFKQYLQYQNLIESLYLKGLNINFSKELQKSPSDSDRISTFVPRLGYKKDIDLNGVDVKVINLYNYVTTEIPQGILKSIKGKGPYLIDDATYTRFLDFTVEKSVELIGRQNIEYVIYPKSSSYFIKDFIDLLEAKLPKVVFLHEGIIKKQLEDTEEYVRDNMIDTDYYGYTKMGPARITEIIKSIIRNIKKNDTAGKGKIITLKDVGNKIGNHVIKGFMEVVHEGIFEIEGKNILIVDDILSTGTSFKDLIRVVKDFNPSAITGLAIFKGESKKAKA
jgi:hypothetical protein